MSQMPRALLERIGDIKALDRVGKTVGKAFDGAVKPGALKDFLAGTWLGHPLHPVLTDLPIGFWSSSFALDVFGGKDGERASEILLGLGVLSALPTAASGLTDWTDTGGAARRIGLVHAIGNVATTACFTASLVARRRGHRRKGIALSALGVGGQSFSAYLGGHLSFGKGIGVDNTAFDREPRRWTAVVEIAALNDGKPVKAEAAGADVLLYRDGPELFAISDTCSHRGCSLSDGDVRDRVVECACHGSAFRLGDGEIVRGPATAPQPAYDTRVTDGVVEVRLRRRK